MSSNPTQTADDGHEMVPGTIYLVDILHNHAGLTHASGKAKDVVLVPQPSDNLLDPLRWGNYKKGTFIAILWLYAFITGSITLGISTVYVNVLEELETTALGMNAGAATQLLTLGLSNLVLIPLSLKFGRRPVYLVTMFVLLCSQILQMTMNTEAQLIGSYILSGIGAAPFDVLVEISFSDITYAHQRGSLMALYLLAPASGSFLGPLFQGYIATGQGDWRWVMRWGLIFSAIILVLMFFFLEESLFIRDSTHRTVVYSAPQIEGTQVESTQMSTTEGNVDEKKKPATLTPVNDNSVSVLSPSAVFQRTGSRFALWQNFPVTWTTVFHKILAGITVLQYPAILWGGLLYGTIISWLTTMAITEASFFFGPPYLFNASQVGNLNVAPFIGCVLGLPIAGFINDRIVLHLAGRNGGYSEPEFRLWILIPVAFIQAGGLIIYGSGIARGMPWIMPAIGMGMIGFCLVVGISVLLSYVLDCYKEIGEEAITGVLLCRAVFSAGFTFAISPWIDTGVENAFIAMGMIGFAGFISSLVFIRWGKHFRRRTAESYIAASLEVLYSP